MSRELEENCKEIIKLSDDLQTRIATIKALVLNGTETAASGSAQATQIADEFQTINSDLESLKNAFSEADDLDTQEDLDFITTAYKEKILHLQDMHKDSLNDIGEVKEKLEEVSNFKAEVDKENEELLNDDFEEAEDNKEAV